MARAAYVHIPFCAHKCDFCDFAAFSGLDHLASEYCHIVAQEIQCRLSSEPNNEPLSSIFFGGGTPGYIEPDLLNIILHKLNEMTPFAKDIEISLETTPHAITREKTENWLKAGINRLSIGVESFDDHELKAMGRDHTEKQAIKGISVATESGLENISIDLMYGLPEQTIQSFETSIEKSLSFGLPHLSAYGLTIANNSPLLTRYPKNSPSYPTEDVYVHMYESLLKLTEAYGLNRYEISNFSKNGFKSKHNITYWLNEDYLAFGVSAHRYVNGVRSSNYRSLNKYMKDFLTNETYEVIDEKTKINEAVMLGLRLKEGISLEKFKAKYEVDILLEKSNQITNLIDNELLELEDGRLFLSTKGVLVSNLVIGELI
jgi:oxygen-independent coproporphyrinogen-3 oxidase